MPCKHQVRKPPKSAPGEAISGPTRYENTPKSAPGGFVSSQTRCLIAVNVRLIAENKNEFLCIISGNRLVV